MKSNLKELRGDLMDKFLDLSMANKPVGDIRRVIETMVHYEKVDEETVEWFIKAVRLKFNLLTNEQKEQTGTGTQSPSSAGEVES